MIESVHHYFLLDFRHLLSMEQRTVINFLMVRETCHRIVFAFLLVVGAGGGGWVPVLIKQHVSVRENRNPIDFSKEMI